MTEIGGGSLDSGMGKGLARSMKNVQVTAERQMLRRDNPYHQQDNYGTGVRPHRRQSLHTEQ